VKLRHERSNRNSNIHNEIKQIKNTAGTIVCSEIAVVANHVT